jgi:hypothetical protein
MTRLKRIWHFIICGSNHFMVKHEKNSMWLECEKCLYCSPGWKLETQIKVGINANT